MCWLTPALPALASITLAPAVSCCQGSPPAPPLELKAALLHSPCKARHSFGELKPEEVPGPA